MNSIRTYLAVMLMAAFSLVSFLASLNGYLSSMAEAEKMLDAQLAEASDLLMLSWSGDVPEPSPEAQSEMLVFQVWRDGELLSASPGAPAQAIGEFSEGHRFTNFSGYRWLSYTRQGEDGTAYMLAERADLRHRVAENVVLESVLPLLLWLPASAVLVWMLVGWGLRPLHELSAQINQKRSDDLAPVTLDNPPVELVQLIESTNSLLARLSAAFEREKHFAAHAAHELRTPLSVLKVHLHNLAEELPADEPALIHANAGVERMHHLVEQILDLSRTNPELIVGNFQSLDLHSLAQRVTAMAWPQFAAREQTLSLDGEEAWLLGDPALLETLLSNLLDNAGKYTPEGGEVRVQVEPHPEGVRLWVEDSGPGIPTEDREQVFERFYRVGNGVENAPVGSGLGLAIVRHIVQVHNAEIVLGESELGGLSVCVGLPGGGSTG
jgi:two-component system sensor histidine kinase QseC